MPVSVRGCLLTTDQLLVLVLDVSDAHWRPAAGKTLSVISSFPSLVASGFYLWLGGGLLLRLVWYGSQDASPLTTCRLCLDNVRHCILSELRPASCRPQKTRIEALPSGVRPWNCIFSAPGSNLPTEASELLPPCRSPFHVHLLRHTNSKLCIIAALSLSLVQWEQ